MLNQNSFIEKQIQFTQHIRDPQHQPKPDDVEERRMAIYRDLIYNNVEGFISSGFPVIRSIYSEENWHKLIRDFFIKHQCHTPLFLEISQEFIAYLQNERKTQAEDPAGLIELAHYEWVELALSISQVENDLTLVNPNGNLLEQHPVISNLAWPLSYAFPVHKMSAEYLPKQVPEQATHLIVYRDRLDEVQFMEINAVTARLLALINEQPESSGRQILEIIAEELQADLNTVINGGLNGLQDLQARGIIIGISYQPD